AARSTRAWKWVARLFLSDRHSDHLVAEHALGITANLVPTRVAAASRLRLLRTPRLRRNTPIERRKRDRLLSGAITPFLGVSNRLAAEIALRLVERYSDWVEPGEEGLNG